MFVNAPLSILEKAELRRVRFHDLRHTFASLLIQQGESLAYVKDQLGHASIQITVDVYGHLVPGGNCAAVDLLDDAQPSATPAQPEAVATVARQTLSTFECSGEPGGNRTHNPQIKSLLLCQLSYRPEARRMKTLRRQSRPPQAKYSIMRSCSGMSPPRRSHTLQI